LARSAAEQLECRQIPLEGFSESLPGSKDWSLALWATVFRLRSPCFEYRLQGRIQVQLDHFARIVFYRDEDFSQWISQVAIRDVRAPDAG
jgi:hypothetical protein